MLKYRKMNPDWCHCDISSPSAHSDRCINDGCSKYIPSYGQVMQLKVQELEQVIKDQHEELIELRNKYIDLRDSREK